MPVPLLDLKAQYQRIRDEVVSAMTHVLDEQTFILGDVVKAFEDDVAAFCRVKHAVGCASGTDAILLALRALDIGRGDEVVTTPFTFFATAGAVHNVGAKPVFADIEPDTFNIAPAAVAAAVTGKTKAVIPVDLFGQMAELEKIRDAIGKIPIIEDAAQSIGASRRINGEPVLAGERADMGTISFFPSKNLGAYGDAGMVVTQDDALAKRLRRLRVHGGEKIYYHEEVGYNSRLDALQAAVLRAKLPHLEKWSVARRENANYYNAAFADLADVRTPTVDSANVCIYNQYTLRVVNRNGLQAHLKQLGIGSSVYYPLPLHLQPCFAYLGYKAGDFPESEKAAAEVLSLPIYPELTHSQLDEVIGAVRGFYGS